MVMRGSPSLPAGEPHGVTRRRSTAEIPADRRPGLERPARAPRRLDRGCLTIRRGHPARETAPTTDADTVRTTYLAPSPPAIHAPLNVVRRPRRVHPLRCPAGRRR